MKVSMASGCALSIVSSLLVLTACTNATPPASGNAASGATQVARMNGGSDNTNSVNAVSDALGRRLDDMLSARQASR